MSAKATFWAWEQPIQNSVDKLVLLCLSDCYNADTRRCDPSTNYISDKTGLNKKTVPVSLNRLKELGLIDWEMRPGTSRNYFLYLDKNAPQPTPKTGIPKNGVTQKRGNPKTDQTLPKNGEGVYPKTGTKPKKNLKEPKTILDQFDFSSWPGMPDHQTLRDWFEMRKRIKAAVTQTAINRLGSKLREATSLGHSVDDCLSEAVMRSWRGFDVKWLSGQPRAGVEKTWD